MTLKTLKYSSLGNLLDHEPRSEEDADTAKIIRRLRHVKVEKELSRGEFLEMCRWKSPRSIRQCERNSARTFQTISRKVFTSRNEKKRLELLTSLYGVSIPTASAILTLTNPSRYGVIDIRVWQLLYRLGSVNENARGQGFTFEQWHRYLMILRSQAKRLGVPVRLIELTLFRYHQDHQRGTLYRTKTRGEHER
jgi:thermostable 8-oxoguanine DNA glycosylase